MPSVEEMREALKPITRPLWRRDEDQRRAAERRRLAAKERERLAGLGYCSSPTLGAQVRAHWPTPTLKLTKSAAASPSSAAASPLASRGSASHRIDDAFAAVRRLDVSRLNLRLTNTSNGSFDVRLSLPEDDTQPPALPDAPSPPSLPPQPSPPPASPARAAGTSASAAIAPGTAPGLRRATSEGGAALGGSQRDKVANALGWSLVGKVVLVTGAAQGLGLVTSRLCAAAGAAGLALVDRNSSKGREAERELSAHAGCACLFIQCDVASPGAIEAAVAAADRHFGRIDALVNAAGDTRRSDLDGTSVELWDALIAVNLRAPFLLTQAVSRVMRREGRGGAIVNVASVQAHGGLTCCMAYATTKGGLLTLTRNNAAELGRDGIRVNAINMGWTPTENEHALQKQLGQGDDWLDAADQTSHLERICRTDDVARAIVFLLAGAHCTGAVLELHPEHIPGMLGGGIGKAK